MLRVAHEAHQVLRVAAVMNREIASKPDALGVLAKKPRTDAVKRSGPGQRRRALRCPAREHRAENPACAPLELERSASAEGEQ